MGYKPVILRSAQIEYVEIVTYLAEILESKQAASSFIAEFAHQIDIVCDNPYIFALSRLPELSSLGYRTFFVNSYIALYKVVGNKVVIAHIFHQSQNYAKYV